MPLPKYDLHCHSTASDGVLSPSDLVARALEQNVRVLALTDHDTVEGLLALQRQGLPDNFRLITGVELTCVCQGRVLHVVGLGMNPQAGQLQTYLQALQQLRMERGKKIARRLVRQGLPDLYAAAGEVAGEAVLGRPHFAKAMVVAGCVTSEQQAFKQYLGIGKPGDVKVAWPEMAQAVDVIRQSGGVAVLAHPTKYKMTFSRLRRVLVDFVEYGGQGLEVAYPGVTPDQKKHLLHIAEQYRLAVSAGSDFHSPKFHWTELGKFPQLPDGIDHILDMIA